MRPPDIQVEYSREHPFSQRRSQILCHSHAPCSFNACTSLGRPIVVRVDVDIIRPALALRILSVLDATDLDSVSSHEVQVACNQLWLALREVCYHCKLAGSRIAVRKRAIRTRTAICRTVLRIEFCVCKNTYAIQELIPNKLVLEAGEKLRLTGAAASGRLSATVSILEIT